MTQLWQNLTARERVLMVAGGTVVLLVLVYFSFVRPLDAYRQESRDALMRAQAAHARILGGAMEVKNLKVDKGVVGQKMDAGADSIRVIAARTARDTGVTISRLQPGQDSNRLTIWIEAVTAPKLYRWLAVMADDHGIAPAKVMVQKSAGDGQVRVQLEFGVR